MEPIPGLKDSKKMTPKMRDKLFDEIRAKALCFCVAQATVEEIDQFNILNATMLAMKRAIEGLRLLPTRALVDGNCLPFIKIPSEAIVKGDSKIGAISAASILAKVHRDRLCLALDKKYPSYGFAIHKGYPTQEHRIALRVHGPCPEHRRSFKPVREILI
jgi:ribonuclease HII